MLLTRRHFSLAAVAAALVPTASARAQAQSEPRPVDLARIDVGDALPAARPLDILMLGGTVFVGPAVVKAALVRGHRVTIYNRGRSNPSLFPTATRVRGDRLTRDGAGLRALAGRRFDAVVDTWADAPEVVRASARALAGSADRYLLVSSISAYDPAAWRSMAELTETAPRIALPPALDWSDPATRYGVRKRAAEDAVADAFPANHLIVRAHQILGYHIARDSAGQRYWPMRFAHGGDILVPGDGLDRTQFIDVGDLGRFIVHLLETGVSGAFNTMRTMAWRDFTASLAQAAGTRPRLRWTPEAKLAAAAVRPMADLPMWVPRQRGPGFMGHVSARADAAGLTHREPELLWRDVIAGTRALYPAGFAFQTSPTEAPLSLARERELLAGPRA